MQIKIRTNNTCGSWSRSKEVEAFFKENAGKWVNVETDCLFTNQYNTARIRVMDRDVEAVRDDARIGKGKCKYCGRLVNAGEECTHHTDCAKYGIEWFTTENTFFIKYPNGIPEVKNIEIKDEPKFGSFRLEHLGGVNNVYRLQNARQKFVFKYADGHFWMDGGKCVKHLNITAQSFDERKLKEYLDKQ